MRGCSFCRVSHPRLGARRHSVTGKLFRPENSNNSLSLPPATGPARVSMWDLGLVGNAGPSGAKD